VVPYLRDATSVHLGDIRGAVAWNQYAQGARPLRGHPRRPQA
jgi:hypothetical protein